MPRVFALLFFVVLGVGFPASAVAQTSPTGGAQFSDSDPAPIVAPGSKATLLPDGTAAAPADAPPQVQAAIFAANKLLDKPYKYGGGHAKVEDSGYDCSGTVSYALLAAKQPVRVIVRDAAKGEPWKAKGADVAIASLDDRAALARALAGATGAYLILPPNGWGETDLATGRKQLAAALVGAVADARPGHVVLLSSIGTMTRSLGALVRRVERPSSFSTLPSTCARPTAPKSTPHFVSYSAAATSW